VHLAWTVFEPNDPSLATMVESAIATLMVQVWEAGALVGGRAEDAYALQVDQSQAAAGRFVLVLGVALARPAEFITLRVSRTDNRLEIREMPEVVRTGASS
jgi:phage tail sheath protein FI